MLTRKSALLVFGVLLLSLQGCAPSVYAVDPPEASPYVFGGSEVKGASRLNIIDQRDDQYTSFTSGSLPMGLTHRGETLDPVDFLAKYTIEELVARGIPVTADSSDATDVEINKIVMRNHRSTGFSPFTTVTMLCADILTPNGEHRAGAFIMRGKVPVWSFNEVIEPTMNQPLELLVKELAAKINMVLYGQSASDATVQMLIDKVNADPAAALAYLDVYELGFSNNPTAIDALLEMTRSSHEYIRLAAISSLGTINAHGQVNQLIEIFNGDGIWQDRAMAVKSLGDIAAMGNERAMTFLQNDVEPKLQGESATGAEWAREILGLYLRS
jgi:hypothetical protein